MNRFMENRPGQALGQAPSQNRKGRIYAPTCAWPSSNASHRP